MENSSNLTSELVLNILKEFTWPVAYEVQPKKSSAVVISFPNSHICFIEGIYGDVDMAFLPEDTKADELLYLSEALVVKYPPNGSAEARKGLIEDVSSPGSLQRVSNDIRDMCNILLTHVPEIIMGDFKWVEEHYKMENEAWESSDLSPNP